MKTNRRAFVLALTLLAGGARPGSAEEPAYAPTDAERARWTMSDMRTLATAVAAYRIDNGACPGAATLAELIPLIEPIYIRKAPLRDAWGTEFRYLPSADRAEFRIVSAGADRRFGLADESATGEFSDFSEDAVWRNDGFLKSWAYR